MAKKLELAYDHARCCLALMSERLMEKKNFAIRGMSCAACAAKIERNVKKVQGVSEVNVMLLKNSMTVVCDDEKVTDECIEKAVSDAGYEAFATDGSVKLEQADDSEAKHQKNRLIASFLLLAVLVLLAMGPVFSLNLIDDVALSGTLQGLLALAVMILQRKYYISAAKALAHGGFNMDTLVSLGSLMSFIYSCYSLSNVKSGAAFSSGDAVALYFDTAAAILTFVSIGKFFEARTKVKTADAVTMLYDLAPKFVTVKKAEGDKQVMLSEVKKGDILLIKAGEQIGVDAEVVAGSGFVDESSLTGESRPVKKIIGSKILSASVLTQGVIEAKALAVGSETTLSKIIALVDEASSKKAPIARIADYIAGIFVPTVIALSALTFVIWYWGLDAALREALNYAVSVLVVSCPCALGLATPLAIVAGTGRAAKAGILFKSPEVIEKLCKATAFIFDKTGTLTVGNMTITAECFAKDCNTDDIKSKIAALEGKSSHPLAAAVVKKYGNSNLEVNDFIFNQGHGVEGIVSGTLLSVGNRKLLEMKKAFISEEQKAFASVHENAGATVLYVIADNQTEAVLAVSDEIKLSSKKTIRELNALGIKTLMLTGDSEKVAQSTASELGIANYRAELMPDDKAAIIKDLQQHGENVVMIGDGVNDSVALATADTGIGLAGTSDIAVSSCSVVLLRGNLIDAVNATILARRTMKVIKENLFWAFIYNLIFIPVAAGVFSVWGWHLTPVAGAVMMSLSSVCVGLNALRLTKIKIDTVKDKKEIEMSSIVLDIEGMSCKHCVAAVTKALQAVLGVVNVEVSLERKNAVVSFENKIDEASLINAVTAAGYEVKGTHY